ncbi:MAG: glycoside hydrolase family 44 protein [Anaerolineae bacterium]
MRFAKIFFFLILAFLPACAPTNPNEVFPTPTFAIDLSQNRSQDIEIITLDNVIEATAVPFDFTRVEVTEEEKRRATIEAIQRITIKIDATQVKSRISPLIYGISLSDETVVKELQPPMYSWTGDGAVRYNIKSGRGWNEGRESFYKNEDPAPDSDNFAIEFLNLAESIGAATSFTLPTIGWVAKDTSSCSFPDIELGNCTRGFESTCFSGRNKANPTQTSESITSQDIVTFVQNLKENGKKLDFVSMLHEPGEWGIVHYDVHPECVTYSEILDLYTTYAAAIRDELPDAEFMGPGTCCWDLLFNSPAGDKDKLKYDNEDFIPWFLKNMQTYDEAAGKRHLDVLEVHYFPQDLDNDFDDLVVAEHRLRAHRSLFDPLYTDESDIQAEIQLIPRLNAWINEFYPGTKLAIGAWNFGAPDSINGALAIAEVLGVYGKEGLYYATYVPGLEKGSPAFYAFKIFTNYDDKGGSFGDLVVDAESDHPDEVSVYSSLDSETGNLHIILINRIKEVLSFETEIVWEGFESTGEGAIYTFSTDLASDSAEITGGPSRMGINKQVLSLPGYSITHMILEPVPEQDNRQE